MDDQLATEVRTILVRTFGEDEGGRISGSYLLAYNLATSQRALLAKAAPQPAPATPTDVPATPPTQLHPNRATRRAAGKRGKATPTPADGVTASLRASGASSD